MLSIGRDAVHRKLNLTCGTSLMRLEKVGILCGRSVSQSVQQDDEAWTRTYIRSG